MAGNKKALCVGINKFKNFPSAALQGCVNDTLDMVAVLTKYLEFGDKDIVTLTDDKATKENIMANLNEMVDGAKAGKYNYLVFSLSSHGTQVPDLSGDEPDKADEAFCPTDLAQKGDIWDPAHIIVDDELHDLFVQIPANVLLECYLDTCHSGTGLKAIDLLLNRRPRYLPPPSLAAFEKVEGRSSRGLHQALLESGSSNHILWAGCRSDQTSADAKIEDTWHGAFTYYLCKHINASGAKITRRELLKKVRADLKAGKYTQVPQLETKAAKRKESIS
ncbi:MAG: caspase family protein [Methanotrichaceae archaeon]|nr:caspase family protein [Methanotrichaceae archaeon]